MIKIHNQEVPHLPLYYRRLPEYKVNFELFFYNNNTYTTLLAKLYHEIHTDTKK